MISVHQNANTFNLEEYKTKLLNEMQKMTVDLALVVEKKLEDNEVKTSILKKIKEIQNDQ